MKGLLQLDQLKQHMVTIGIDQLLSDCAMYEHRFMEKLRNYTHLLENEMINFSLKKF